MHPRPRVSARVPPHQDASLFDVSHMGSLRITGKDRVAFLESVTVGDVQALAEDQARLSSIVNDKFGIIDGASRRFRCVCS